MKLMTIPERSRCLGFKVLLVVSLIFVLQAAFPAETAEPAESGSATRSAQDTAEEIKKLRLELDHLRDENTQLRRENQQLRRMLAELVEPASSKPSIVPTGAAMTNQTNTVKSPAPEPVDNARAYWLSNSGKRHNRTCRYYKKVDGQPCGPNEGTACKLCGG